MPEIVLQKLAEYGILGLVVAGMAWALYYQAKSYRQQLREKDHEIDAERGLWNEERKSWHETNEKYLELSVEIIQANSKAMAELTAYIQQMK